MINFEKLNVYQDAVTLALDVYRLTSKFPKDEIFGVTSQLRRAAVSISLNIAEGSSRSTKEFSHFLDMARGSTYELIPLIKICLDLEYITEIQYKNLYGQIDDIARRISALKKSVNR